MQWQQKQEPYQNNIHLIPNISPKFGEGDISLKKITIVLPAKVILKLLQSPQSHPNKVFLFPNNTFIQHRNSVFSPTVSHISSQFPTDPSNAEILSFSPFFLVFQNNSRFPCETLCHENP